MKIKDLLVLSIHEAPPGAQRYSMATAAHIVPLFYNMAAILIRPGNNDKDPNHTA